MFFLVVQGVPLFSGSTTIKKHNFCVSSLPVYRIWQWPHPPWWRRAPPRSPSQRCNSPAQPTFIIKLQLISLYNIYCIIRIILFLKLQMKWKLIHLLSVYSLTHWLICLHNALVSHLNLVPGFRACL